VILRGIFSVMTGLLAVSGYSQTVPVDSPASTFTFRIPYDPGSLDWHRAYSSQQLAIIRNIMEGLVRLEKDFSISPAIASKWSMSPDGRKYTFTIRPGARWTDGVPVKAKDFVFSWKKLLAPATAISNANYLFDVLNAENYYKGKLKNFDSVGVKALDDSTLEVRLERPVAHWLFMLTVWATFPLREDVVKKYSDSWDSPGRIVSAGPFMITERDADTRIVMRPNPYYYGTRGNIKKAVALVVLDDRDAQKKYDEGGLDLLSNIALFDLKKYEKSGELKKIPYWKTCFFGFTAKKYPVSNETLRRAIAMSIDKKKILELLHGGQRPADWLIPTDMFSPLGLKPSSAIPYDPVRAKRELVASGINPSRITLEYLSSNRDRFVKIANFIKEELKKHLGIEVVIQALEFRAFAIQREMGAFHMFNGCWGSDYPDPDQFLMLFLGSSGNFRSAWNNPAYDEKLMRVRGIKDKKERYMAYLEMQKMLVHDNVIVVPMFFEANTTLIKPRVSGYVANALDQIFLKEVNVR